VASAPLDAHGSINCSPKGNRDELRVLDGRRVAYLDQTGSGVETIAHLRGDGRDTEEFARFAARFAAPFALADGVGVRSVVVVDVVRVSDSCGDGVPFMSFESHRPTMDQWST
jgi:hypothetical protein